MTVTKTWSDLNPSWDDSWPKPVLYVGPPKGSDRGNAALFLAARPYRLIVSNGIFYSLHDGVWYEIDIDALAHEIELTDAPNVLDVGGVFGVMNALKMMCFTDARPFQWIEKPSDAPAALDMILFGDGLLDFKNKKLHEYNGSFFATGRPKFDYDPEAKCPRWMQCLDEWFEEESSDPHGSVVQTLQEFFGYVLTADTSLHVILSLLGSGRAGKSTVVKVLESLVGTDHTQERNLANLGGPHGLEGLESARLLVIPDASDADLSSRATALGNIKAISGGDRVGINPKNKKHFSCVLPARIVMVANKHPKFLDESGALAMRELPVMFVRSFEQDKAKDPQLFDKLERELPGIANWSLAGLARLRARGAFTEGDILRRARADIEHQQSHMSAFAAACLRFSNPNARVSKSAMYNVYEAWHQDARIKFSETRNKEQFKGDLLAACQRKGVRLTKRKSNMTEGWWGVDVRDVWRCYMETGWVDDQD